MQHAKISNTCKPQVVSTALKMTNLSSDVGTRQNTGCNIALMWCFSKPPLALTRDFLMQIRREWGKIIRKILGSLSLLHFTQASLSTSVNSLRTRLASLCYDHYFSSLQLVYLKNKSSIINLLHWAQSHCQHVPTVTQTHSLHMNDYI